MNKNNKCMQNIFFSIRWYFEISVSEKLRVDSTVLYVEAHGTLSFFSTYFTNTSFMTSGCSIISLTSSLRGQLINCFTTL